MAEIAHIERYYRDVGDIVERINCGVVAADEHRNILFANHRLLRWLDYAMDDLEGRPFTALFPEALHDRIWEEALAAEHGDLRARVTALQRRDATLLPVLVLSVLPVPLNCANTTAWVPEK